ncbi:MAG: phage major capsid protein [Solirubrobacterales bacterium]
MDERRAKREELTREVADLVPRINAEGADSGIAQRVKNLRSGISKLDREIADGDVRMAQAMRQFERGHTEGGDVTDGQTPERKHTMSTTKIRGEGTGTEIRDAALRDIDRAFDRGQLGEPAGERLVDIVTRDRFDLDSAYISAISSPEYERAFAKKITGFSGAEATLTPEEAEAMQTVGRAMATRSMAVGEGATGGFAIPLSLDPTVLLTNDGAINPIRELATVSTITTTTWQGVSSAGVKAEFAAEAAEAEDGAPKLGQPEITPEKAQIWVPYSIESGMDWPGLAAELARIFADAKSVKEAEIFATGKGSENIPQGLISGATKLVESATKEVFASADVYSLQEALAPRWQPRATWLGANKVANQIHKFVAKGDTEEAALMSDDRSEILGKGYREVSTMSTKTTTKKERVLAYGDIASAYRIVDRIGMAVEPVPLVLKEGVPTGERGLFAYFRVGAKVIIPEAVQVLAVKE